MSLVARSMVVAALSLVSTLAVGCAAPADEPVAAGAAAASQAEGRRIAASTDPAHEMVASLWEIDSVGSADELMIRLYGTGGGDPAMNGNNLWLAIDGGPTLGAIWDLELNVATVDAIASIAPGTVRVTGTEQTLDEDDAVISRPFEATITYRLKDGALGPSLQIEHGASVRDVQADTTKAAAFLSRVYAVSTVETDAIHARLFEVGGGDPAMNGDRLFLTLGEDLEWPTFELGLDVASVTRFASAGAGKLRIDVSEDTLDADGMAAQKQATYVVTFTKGHDGPDPSVTVSKL